MSANPYLVEFTLLRAQLGIPEGTLEREHKPGVDAIRESILRLAWERAHAEFMVGAPAAVEAE